MLERLSTSVDGARQKTSRVVGDRFNVFGTRKMVPFHIVISELRAELMNVKQHAPGQPCMLLWVRGDTVHVTEDSVGQTVLSWSDTYFAQVVPLQVSGAGFRSKECKFKVQQKGKTIAKTAVVDLTKYCSEIGLARDQSVSVPLQPSGTLYFVISTAPASEQQQQHANEMLATQSSSKNLLMRASHNPSLGGGGGGGGDVAAAAVTAAGGAAAAAAAGRPDGTSVHSAEGSKHRHLDASPYASTASKYGGAVAGAATAAASALASAITPGGPGKARAATPEAGPSPDDGDRASTSGQGHQRKPSGGLSAAGWVAGLAAKASPTTPPTADGGASGAGGAGATDDKSVGTGVFKRKARGASKPMTAFAAAGGAAAANDAAMVSAAGGGGGGRPNALTPQLTLRKSDSDNVIAGPDGRIYWDEHAERSLSQALVCSNGRQARGSGSGYASAHRAIRSFTGSPPTRGTVAGPVSSPLQPLQLPQSAIDGIRSLARGSAAPSTCSDTAVLATAAAGAASAGKGEGGGGGWGTWIRSGLGLGRASNQSATGTASGAASQTSLPNGAGGGGGTVGGGGVEASALETAIAAATEPAELRELALDLMHERDEWRARALAAQDAAARAQASRGSAVREAQRLEIRLRQYQDELGRRTDGSLLQELVEAKVRIAELANENMKLRRQITHMGPLFYDPDSGDDALTPDPRN